MEQSACLKELEVLVLSVSSRRLVFMTLEHTCMYLWSHSLHRHAHFHHKRSLRYYSTHRQVCPFFLFHFVFLDTDVIFLLFLAVYQNIFKLQLQGVKVQIVNFILRGWTKILHLPSRNYCLFLYTIFREANWCNCKFSSLISCWGSFAGNDCLKSWTHGLKQGFFLYFLSKLFIICFFLPNFSGTFFSFFFFYQNVPSFHCLSQGLFCFCTLKPIRLTFWATNSKCKCHSWNHLQDFLSAYTMKKWLCEMAVIPHRLMQYFCLESAL